MKSAENIHKENFKDNPRRYFTREEVNDYYEPGSWQGMLLSEVRQFPCVFGVSGFKSGQIRFAFLRDLDPQNLAEVLRQFVANAHSFGKNTSLVVFAGPDVIQSIEQYRQRFWTLLRGLHEADKVEWPSEVPMELNDPNWEFCFAGEPIFVVCNTPAHIQRQSRRGSVFTVTFQPRWVFEHILGTEQSARAAFRVVSERLAPYDMVPKAAILGRYGDPEVREWKQYFLEEDNSEPRCPFHKLAQKEETHENHQERS
jgi:uncharacterized protein